MNTPAELIRQHLETVAALRAQPDAALPAIKRLQAQRFEATYADLLSTPRYQPATRFFLDELYGDHDFAQRDAQFGRIAGAIERLFPQAVVQLAVDMAELHALTEGLDAEMARHWDKLTETTPAARYVAAWRLTGQRSQREQQLRVVLHMGRELQHMTGKKSLRLALRMMRGPAQAAGLGALQGFLEAGFDAFGHMGGADGFLNTIASRERAWIDRLFDSPEASAALAELLPT